MKHENNGYCPSDGYIEHSFMTPTAGGQERLTIAASEAVSDVSAGHARQDEANFYKDYIGHINPYPTVAEVLDHLRNEVRYLETRHGEWQFAETAINIFLFACAAANSVDEFLHGPALRLPRRFSQNYFGSAARAVIAHTRNARRARTLAKTIAWRKKWLQHLDGFLSVALVPSAPNRMPVIEAARRLAALSHSFLPRDLLDVQTSIPSPFRRLDLTHHDVLALGQCFVERFPDRSQALILLGLRTSGSYFVILLRAFLRANGYENVELLTIQPDSGLGGRERYELKRHAAADSVAIIVDDPPRTGGTIFAAYNLVRRVGFARDRVKLLVPVHNAKTPLADMCPESALILLEFHNWHLRRLFSSGALERRILDYFSDDPNVVDIRFVDVEAAKANEWLRRARDKRGVRLKKVYALRLTFRDGRHETRFFLAKSVGWGWLGYHAYLAAARLDGLVPSLVGLRDGVLFTEWLPQDVTRDDDGRRQLIEATATYVARRTRSLRLEPDPVKGRGQERHQNGFVLLTRALARAYGGAVVGALAQQRVARELRKLPNPFPTLIDGKMDREKWIVGPHGWVKADFEQHGMGKSALNVSDPAFDLADAILKADLSQSEERKLISLYIAKSGDSSVRQRLMAHKVLAGLWEMDQAREDIFGKGLAIQERLEHHQRFMKAWSFLTTHGARFCGDLCELPREMRWRAPLVALDIDGVLDRRLFGFPITTPSAAAALSLLHANGFCIVVNTARSAAEVKTYCESYSLVGGIAEHGAYIWDGVGQQERVLISEEAVHQLDELRRRLRATPGVFLDDRHQFSIRAFTYRDKPQGLLAAVMRSMHTFDVGDGALAPLPSIMAMEMIAEMGLDLLRVDNTSIDTTITSKEVDKGVGLAVLREWMLPADAETIAVGDTKADLAMFKVATRSFAPANINCATSARWLGCRIASRPYQRGLLEIAKILTRTADETNRGLEKTEDARFEGSDPILRALYAADRNWQRHFARAIADSATYRMLWR